MLRLTNMLSCKNGDLLSYDCSYNNLELSFGRETSLFAISDRFKEYYYFLQSEFGKYNYTLTGMGVNPYRIYNKNVPIPNGRYRMLYHHLHSCKNYDLPMFFHSYPEYGTFSRASQVQLDVAYDKLPITLNAFSKLEPLKAILFSNSVLLDEHEEALLEPLYDGIRRRTNPARDMLSLRAQELPLEDIIRRYGEI